MDSPQRKIAGAMAVTIMFAIFGQITKQPAPKATGTKPAAVNPFTILLGGAVATGLLVGIAEFGDVGEHVGLGISVLAVISSTLVNGAPVWSWLNQRFGSKPTTPLPSTLATGVSQTTGLTAPTAGTAAAAAALA